MPNRLAVTGVLLVGGASERFGSPKALAPFRGETLGERAWRVLHEVCEEVFAVGKGDGAELPFPVFDDGANERAPIFGLIAGLRLASHDVCLVLPVDCPLVTPDTLRALAATRTIPQTGPLPGAYPKDALAELEERVARGELSLRGVNPLVLDVDETLLLNVNTPMDLIAAAVAEWAQEREDVRAAVVVGSQARENTPADRWSDLDIALFVDDPAAFTGESDWVRTFGRPVLTFLEPTAVGSRMERRVLYADGSDVDFSLVEASGWESLAVEAAGVIGRGYRVLHDEIGVTEALAAIEPPAAAALPDARGVRRARERLLVPRALDREEAPPGRGVHGDPVPRRIHEGAARHAARVARARRSTRRPTPGTAAGSSSAGPIPGALSALEKAYAHYDLRDVARALWETIDLWQGLEEETGKRLGLDSGLDHADLRRRIDEVVPDLRRSTL